LSATSERDENGVVMSSRSVSLGGTVQQKAPNVIGAQPDLLVQMSQELRAPLNAVLGYSQLLESKLEETASSEEEEWVAEILDAGYYQLSLIDEILGLAKIKFGPIDSNIVDVNVNKLVMESVGLVQHLATESRVEIFAPAGMAETYPLRANYTRCKQILVNLLLNTIKYNRKNGVVIIGFERAKENRLGINIADTGIGIPEHKQIEVFEAFSRIGAENTGIGGTGVGLTMVKELVESMDGKVGFESIKGKGSTFWIELPLRTSQADIVDIFSKHDR
jgi:signal transduction histidine kinase